MRKSQPFCRYTILLLALLFISYPAVSQGFGQFKPGIPWRKIDTSFLRVVFPEGMESQANRVTSTILHLDQHNRTTIGPNHKKFTLLINNQGVISNGYVTVMPFRSEFFTTPMQESSTLGSVDWLTTLSIHEYRHVLQYMNLLKGVNKLAYWLAGDAGWGALMVITTPGWYFEGDAVATETALSPQGRGRIPAFTQLSRSLLLNDRTYSYMKVSNGSYRHQVPNEYEAGYLLCSYGRENWGSNLWQQVIQKSTFRAIPIYPFSRSLKQITGLNTRKFYRQSMQDLQQKWKQEEQGITYTAYDPISKHSRIVTDYEYPVFIGDSTLLVAKNSFHQARQIYSIDLQGREKPIVMPGLAQDAAFSASGPLITWSEISYHPRYQTTTYSDIILFDQHTGNQRRLTHRQRLFSPALSPEGNRILALEATSDQQYRIKIFDLGTSEESRLLPNPDNLYFTFPVWDIDGSGVISSVKTSDSRMMIVHQDLQTGEITRLIDPCNQVIGRVTPSGHHLFFCASYSGIQNIYALNRRDGKIRQLTSSRFGAYYPTVSPDGQTLAYCEYNYNGYHLVKADLSQTLQSVVEPVGLDRMPQFDYSYFAEEGGSILDKIDTTDFVSTSYHPILQGMKLHSWTLSHEMMAAGLVAVADNYLQNLHVEGGFAMFLNEGAPGLTARIDYGGLFPVFSAGFTQVYSPGQSSLTDGRLLNTRINQITSLSMSLPLNLTKGAFGSAASLRIGYDFISDHEQAGLFNPTILSSLSLHSITGTINYSIKKRKGLEPVSTPLGLSVQLSAKQSISGIYAAQLQGITDFGIRGILSNHNLIISGGYRVEGASNRYQYLDNFIYPRGYAIPENNQIATIQSSYHFPILYPDLGCFGLVYLMRIRGTLFADYGCYNQPGTGIGLNQQMASAGGELIFDLKWFNLFDLPIGVRASWLLIGDSAQPGKERVIELTIPIIRL